MDPNAVTPVLNPVPPATSPTGAPLIPPKFVPYIVTAASVCGAAAVALNTAGLYPKVQLWLGVAAGIFTILLGGSPGLRKAAPVVLALTAMLLWTAPSRAADLSMGLSVPLTEVRFLDPAGSGKPVVTGLAAGAGYQLQVGLLPSTFLGATWDMLGLGGVALLDFPASGPQVSLAPMVTTLSGAFGVAFGTDLLASYNGQLSGLLAGKVSRVNLFTLLVVTIPFGVGDPIHPATGQPKALRLNLGGQSPPG